jgi:hypothetical protein
MMHDNLDPQVAGQKEQAARRDEDTDREVPMVAMPPVVHAWLDGEKVNDAELKAAGSYELWRQVQSETDRRRRMRTPTPIAGAIMEAIRKDA